MRLAVAIHAPTSPTARADVDALRGRLKRPEMGFSVSDVAAADDLALGLPRALEGTPAGSSVVVFVMAEVQRGPLGVIEIVGATRGVRLEELRAALVAAAVGEALLVLDALFEPQQGVGAGDVASAIARAISPSTSGINLLVALRQPSGDRALSPLCERLLGAFDEVSERGGTMTAGQVGSRVISDAGLVDASSALAYTMAGRDLLLVRPAPRPFEAPGSADATFVEATALLAQGKLEEALGACKRVLFQVGHDHGMRAEVYVRVATIKQRQGKNLEAASNLDKALAIDPRLRSALQAGVLLAASEGRWGDAAALGERLIEATSDEEGRFHALLDLADIVGNKVGNQEGAAALLERARALRPGDEALLERLATFYEGAGHFARLLDVLEGWAKVTQNGYQRAARLASAARVAADRMRDDGRAIQLFDQALRLRRDDPQLCADFAAALERAGGLAPAIKAHQLGSVCDPRRPSTYRALVRLGGKTGRSDLAVQAATVLHHLHEADMDEELLADQHRPDGPLAARRPLAPGSWEKTIAPPGSPGVMSVFMTLDEAACAIKRDELREAQKLARLDPKTRQDPAVSTVTAVRSFAFAGRLLGVPLPDLHIVPEAPGGVAAVMAERLTTVIDRSVLTGRTPGELSFLMARHLAYHRPGARLTLLYPSLAELSALFYAAVHIARPGVTVSTPHAAAAGRLYVALAPRLDDAQRISLDVALREVEATGQRPDFTFWLRRLELTATRAGLLASGDLEAAARLIEHDPAPVGDLGARAKIDDLLSFSVSDAYGELRRDLGVVA